MNKLGTITLLILVFFSSCKVKEKQAKRLVKKTYDNRVILPEIIKVNNSAFEFDCLSYKSKCDYKDANNSQSFTMNLRMKRDSILWISITALGFEVVRAKLDRDSVRVVSRLQKKYYSYGYDYIKKLSGTSLSLVQIQNLLTANLLFLPENYSNTAETLKFKTTESYIENTISINDKSMIVETILQHLVEQANAEVIYTNYKKVDKQQFPCKVDIAIVTPKQQISLLMENSGMNTETIEAFPFEISEKYEKGN